MDDRQEGGQTMRGVFAIPPTPFLPTNELDAAGLAGILQFCLKSCVHGIVMPVSASEFPFLSDDERMRVTDIVVNEVRGAVPVVIGVTGSCLEHALLFTRHARRVGAAAVIAMPPHVQKAGADGIRDYYRRIAAEAGVPVFIQNQVPPIGTPMTPRFLADMIKEVDGLEYIKEESWPSGHNITAVLSFSGPRLKGVMGGMAGRYLIDEYRRGACGTMPACEIADVHVRLWNLLEQGNDAEARRVFNAMLPLLNLEAMYGTMVYKHVLAMRGVIRSTVARDPGHRALDRYDLQELEAAVAELSPLFCV
jgi:4-hydroxy-tetrahydrodipicolinate synthase